MSTVADITSILPNLSMEELQQVERALISIYRQRKSGIIFDDDYGVWTEEDQMAVADQTFQMLDKAEQAKKQTDQP